LDQTFRQAGEKNISKCAKTPFRGTNKTEISLFRAEIGNDYRCAYDISKCSRKASTPYSCIKEPNEHIVENKIDYVGNDDYNGGAFGFAVSANKAIPDENISAGPVKTSGLR